MTHMMRVYSVLVVACAGISSCSDARTCPERSSVRGVGNTITLGC